MYSSNNNQKRILIVDDTPANIEILGEIFKQDYEISVAVEGETALEIAGSSSPPDIILLDIMMPQMDGYEVLKKLKNNEKTENIPVIFVTAKIEDEDEAFGFRLGAVDYIRKPFSSEVAKARVRSQLELKDYRDRLEILVESKIIEVEKTRESVETKEMEKQSLEKALVTQEESAYKNHVYFRELFTNSPFGIILVGKDGNIIRVNRSFCTLTGFKENEITDSESPEFLEPDDIDKDFQLLFQSALLGETKSLHTKCRHKKGFEVPVSSLAYSVQLNGRVEGVFIIYEDISQRKQYEDKLKHQAFHDSLTGIPNRFLFSKSLCHAIEISRNSEDFKFAVMLIDLDRFKSVNDSLGHHIGDKLLKAVTSKIKSCLRSGDIIARLGGDEFAILIYDIKDDDQVISVAERIKKAAESTFIIDGNEIHISASTGIVIDTDKYNTHEKLLRDADLAMYHAKDKGKACYKIFNNELHTEAVKKITIEKDLRKALSKDQLELFYQPIIETESKRLKGFEALLRWNHPIHGMISPKDFIPVAEETDLIIPIGEWIVKQGVSQLRQWRTEFKDLQCLSLNINISVKQFMQKNFSDILLQASDINKISPEHIKIELTESLLMSHTNYSVKKLQTLRNFGFQIVIDDFGTGYSSLSYLHKFPVNDIKIDRSFTAAIGRCGESTEIVKSILTLSKNLGLNVVAEGVETKEQLNILKKLNCKNLQGYFIAKPLNAFDAREFIISNYKKKKSKKIFIGA